MSKTALAWLVIYSGGSILALVRHPIYGLLTYLFDYFNHASNYWWGAGIPNFRWSFIAALITLFSLIIRWERFKPIKAPPFKWLMGLIFVAFLVTYTIAVSFQDSHYRLVYLIKLGLLYFLITKIVQSEREYRMIVWAIILGCFLFGWRAYQNPTLEGGRLEGIGGVDTSSSNGLARLLMISLPFVGLYAFTGKRWERILSILVTPWILNGFILCRSRGAFLGLLAMGATAALPGLKILKFKVVPILLLGYILFFRLADPGFIQRMMGLQNASELAVHEESAAGRIKSWRAGWQLMKDYPFGAGGEGFKVLGPIYNVEVVAAHGGERRSAHSTYIELGTSWGFPGLLLWFAFIGSTFWRLNRFRRSTSHVGTRYVIEATAIQSALAGALVSGIFGTLTYMEALYWLCAIGASLARVSESKKPEKTPTAQSHHRVSDAIIRWTVKRQVRTAKRVVESRGGNHN